MILRELHKNPLFQMFLLYATSLIALMGSHMLARHSAHALLDGEAGQPGAGGQALDAALWLCGHGIALCAGLVLLSLAGLVVSVLRARSREANILGMAALSVLNLLVGLGLMAAVLLAAKGG